MISAKRGRSEKMGGLVIVLLFLAAMLIGRSIFIKFMKRTMNSAKSQGISFSPEGESVSDRWAESGNRRDFEKAELELSAEDFFEDEKTELPSLEEALDGLSETEAEAIIKLAGISGAEEGKAFE